MFTRLAVVASLGALLVTARVAAAQSGRGVLSVAILGRPAATACGGATFTGTLAGRILPPGIYCVSAEAKTGVLTLNGPATGSWTFKVADGASTGALTGTSFSVVMAGGGQACNVIWWSEAAATLTDS